MWEIVSKGVPYVRRMVDERPFKAAYKFENDEDILINRTNNPLERYNRTLNKLLSTYTQVYA